MDSHNIPNASHNGFAANPLDERCLITGGPAVVSASGAALAPHRGARARPRAPQPAEGPVSSNARHIRRIPSNTPMSAATIKGALAELNAAAAHNEARYEALVTALGPIDRVGQDRRFREREVRGFPPSIRASLLDRYLHTAGIECTPLEGAQFDFADRVGFSPRTWNLANFQLGSASRALRSGRVHLGLNDEDICQLADHAAKFVSRMTVATTLEIQYARASAYARGKGIRPPVPVYGKRSLAACLGRLKASTWWRRTMRQAYRRSTEETLRACGLVHSRAALYVSDEVFRMRLQQIERNQAHLSQLQATSDDGVTFTLAELSDRNVSNPCIRRAELMTRIRGFEEAASAIHWPCSLYTVTTPSRFHPVLSRSGKSNPLFVRSTPRDAQEWLNVAWRRARAKLHRDKITIFGFRVAEPHHDGTPHWHLLIFSAPEDRPRIHACFVRYFLLGDNPDEPGAAKHRVTVVNIDPDRGSAAGYLAKYVAKNIDGYGVGVDHEAAMPQSNARLTALRVDAWRSVHGIRQFQQIGGPPVSVYRELRRIESSTVPVIETVRAVADAGDWSAYVSEMGGIFVPAMARPLRLFREFEPRIGLYGDPVGDRIVGVIAAGVVERTRLRSWTISPIDSSAGSRALH